jgi:hypothetical protein
VLAATRSLAVDFFMVVEPFRFQGWIDLKNRHFATLKAFNHQLNFQLRAGPAATLIASVAKPLPV